MINCPSVRQRGLSVLEVKQISNDQELIQDEDNKKFPLGILKTPSRNMFSINIFFFVKTY